MNELPEGGDIPEGGGFAEGGASQELTKNTSEDLLEAVGDTLPQKGEKKILLKEVLAEDTQKWLLKMCEDARKNLVNTTNFDAVKNYIAWYMVCIDVGLKVESYQEFEKNKISIWIKVFDNAQDTFKATPDFYNLSVLNTSKKKLLQLGVKKNMDMDCMQKIYSLRLRQYQGDLRNYKTQSNTENRGYLLHSARQLQQIYTSIAGFEEKMNVVVTEREVSEKTKANVRDGQPVDNGAIQNAYEIIEERDRARKERETEKAREEIKAVDSL